MEWLGKLWDKFIDLIPVERWIRAVGNVLQGLSLAFVLIWMAVIALVVKDWGFSQEQRIGLIHEFLVFLLLVVVIVIILALRQGERLYSPYERSLLYGKPFGTETKARKRREVMKTLPTQIQLLG